MSEQEAKLLSILATTNLDLDTITMTMLIAKETKYGCNMLIEFLENTNQKNINKDIIIKEAIKTLEK